MLKGSIYITDNMDIINNFPMNMENKIISLDEDGILDNYPDIIGGCCLLPPMESKIAEADGDEQRYDMFYSSHLLSPSQQQFLSAIIAFLYRGGNLLFFLPELGQTNTAEKLIQHLYAGYGLHPGIIGHPNPQFTNWYIDLKCIPIWLNMIFSARVISPEEYLFMYPEDAPITNEAIIGLLIEDLQPYGLTINDKKRSIFRYHKLIHHNPKVVPAIFSL